MSITILYNLFCKQQTLLLVADDSFECFLSVVELEMELTLFISILFLKNCSNNAVALKLQRHDDDIKANRIDIRVERKRIGQEVKGSFGRTYFFNQFQSNI